MFLKYRLKIVPILLIIMILIPSFSVNGITRKQLNYINIQSVNNFDNTLLEIISQVNNSQLEKYINEIQSFGPRPTGSVTIEQVKNYLFKELSSLPLDVTYHKWHYDDNEGENIIATINGKKSPNNVIITCAHYDTVSVSPGADDDGSGMASILMMASILSKYKFNSTIKFILFSGEEQGCLGSQEYAREAKEQNINIIGVLALDKIGYAKKGKDGNTIRHHADPTSSWMLDVTENLTKKYYKEIGLKLLRLPFDASSDHKAFVNQGYTGTNFVEQTLNPYYHTSEDTLEYMNISYLGKVCKLAILTIANIANGYSDLTNDDIRISIQGKYNNQYNARLSISIHNKKYPLETANLSITIQMNHLFKNKPVLIKKEYYSIPCIWNFTKEVDQVWRFHLGPQTYSVGLFLLRVSIHGLNDDFPISTSCSTIGIIFPESNILVIPQN